jgi:hypothetical protein
MSIFLRYALCRPDDAAGNGILAHQRMPNDPAIRPYERNAVCLHAETAAGCGHVIGDN